MLTADRTPKVDLATLRSINLRPSAAVPADEIGSSEQVEHPPPVTDTDVSYGGTP
ncbi:MAG: hypothetical protein QOI26_1772 [Pseudonocardiales bacterium]|nr:hypothetical protein [Pseudonocardiales bacterium]